MIELLERKRILNLNKTFSSFIVDVQDAKYNPVHQKYEPGKMYVDDSDEPRYVTQEECDKWNREEQTQFQQNRDRVKIKPIKFIDEMVFKFSENNIKEYLIKLSGGLEFITKQLDWKAIIFLLDYPTPWLSQDNNYEPAKKAISYLRRIGVTDSFNGGFKANGEELKELINNLFWITRCNASLPDCYFSGLKEEFVGSICKYGNIHFNFYSEKTKQEILKVSKDIDLKEFNGNYCYDNFAENGQINGRRINI